MLTVTSEDVCWSIRNVKLDIRKSVIQCFVQFLMFVTAVCVLFVCSLFEPVKPRACHDFACVSCWKITYWNIKKLLPNFQKLLLKFLHIFILRSIYHFIPRVLFPVLRGGLNWSEKGENELKSKLERDFCHQGGYCTTGKYKGHVLRTLSTARMLTPDSSPVTQSLIICTRLRNGGA